MDNITTKLGIDTKNIGIFENFLPQDEVEFILNEIRNVGVDIKNIRKYNDNELQNLLG